MNQESASLTEGNPLGQVAECQLDRFRLPEQKGRRPALVISKSLYNQRTGFVVICPISNTSRVNPFYVSIPPNLKVTGVILSEQFRSLDYKARNAAHIQKCPPEIFNLVMAKIKPVLF